jgi:hypothetical protein
LKKYASNGFQSTKVVRCKGGLMAPFQSRAELPMWFLGLKWQAATLEVKGTHQALTTYGCVALPCPTCSLLSTGDV